MRVTCPSCGADMDLDVLLAHEDSRHALARLATISLPLGKLVLQYLRLFKPATRQMSHTRVVSLVEELLPDLQRGAITRNGREWDADLDTWRIAIEKLLEGRDKLGLPMKSHGYLYEIIAGLADKVEAARERETEAERMARRGSGAAAGPQSLAAAVATMDGAIAAAQKAAEVLAANKGPSLYARRVREQNEARLAARAANHTKDDS